MLLACWLPPSLAASEGGDEPFAGSPLSVRGRPLQVWSAGLSSACDARALDLFVISVEGTPPDERRHLNVFPCRSGPGAGGEPLAFEIAAETVLVDTYEIGDGHGSAWLEVDRRGLAIRSLSSLGPTRRIDVERALPLPPRASGVSRLEMVKDWSGRGRPVAMLPTLEGGLMIDLLDGGSRSLEFPMIASYESQNRDLPGLIPNLLLAEFRWPTLVLGRDNDDEYPDLFALTRWNLWIFHGGKDGFAPQPTRGIPLRPFGEAEDAEFEGNNTHYFAEDLNGDGLSDLMLHRFSGDLTEGNAVTEIYLNPGQGAEPSQLPNVTLRSQNSLAAINPIDLDRDGRSELIRVSTQFGLLQLVRVLLTRRAGASIEVLSAESGDLRKFRTSWKQDISFRMNFGEGRIIGLYPNLQGDWNGDGIRDLLHADGEERMALRLGERGPKGPRFGDLVAHQRIPLRAGRTQTTDLNGDGLDDLIAYDPQDAGGTIWVYYNRGTLPGRRSQPGSTP